jgi:hypothetical protein
MTIPALLPGLRDSLLRKKHGIKKRVIKLLPKRFGINERIRNIQQQAYARHIDLTAEEVSNCQYTIAEEERINYYLGATGKHRILPPDPSTLNRALQRDSRLILADYDYIFQAAISSQIIDAYTLPLLNLFNLLPAPYKRKRFLYIYGDHARKSPLEGVLAKTRRCEDRAVTLLKLNPVRHWRYVAGIPAVDVDYRRKKEMAIWRGVLTGERKASGARWDFVKKFYTSSRHFDVGFAPFPKQENRADPETNLLKDRKTVEEMLRYKFLVCLEGNDVASGLKWMLSSNSVVMMPRPTVSSWVMEEKLQPFVHYIPLADDFSDAEERFHWAVNHEEECMKISRNASEYMSQFMDHRREVLIECAVLKRYLDRIDLL